MSIVSLYRFLISNGVAEGNQALVLRELKQVCEESYSAGYSDCLLHNKKRKLIQKERQSKFVKCFLDFFSDITHNGIQTETNGK